MKFLRAFARWLFGPYDLWRIYALSLDGFHAPTLPSWQMKPLQDVKELACASDPILRYLAQFGQEGAQGFGAWVNGELAAACWYWAGETYKKRNFWPLLDDEAKLVEIATAKRFRGRGIAPQLIAFSAEQMKILGYQRLLARVWHSNRASQSAFRKAGWTYVAFVVQVAPFGINKPLRLVRAVSKTPPER